MFKTKIISIINTNIIFRFVSRFVPKHEPARLSDTNTLDRFIKKHEKILVLTGIWSSVML